MPLLRLSRASYSWKKYPAFLTADDDQGRPVQPWVFHQAEKELTALPALRYDSDHRKRWFKKTIHSVSVMASPDNFLGDLFVQIVQLIFQSRRAARQGCFVQLNFAPKCGITAKTSG
jgi:hypothetical protein